MKNLFAAIGGFFAKIYKAVVSGGDPTIVQLPSNLQITPAEIDECIKAVNIVKAVVNNPVTVLVTDLTPISMDNVVRLDISDAIPAVLAGLTFSKNLIAGIPESADQVNALLANIRLSDDVDKNALYHALLARFIMIASKGSVSWSDAVSIIEVYYKQIFGAPAPVVIQQAAAALPAVEAAIQTPSVNTVAEAVQAAAPVVEDLAPKADPVTEAIANVAKTLGVDTLTPEQIAIVTATVNKPATPAAEPAN